MDGHHMMNEHNLLHNTRTSVISLVSKDSFIQAGNLVWLECGKAKPAKEFRYKSGDTTFGKVSFKRNFLGVALESSKVGEARPISVGTSGVYKFGCYFRSVCLGQHVCPAIGSGCTLLSKTIVSAINREEAIGRVSQFSIDSINEVLVDIVSTIMGGGL